MHFTHDHSKKNYANENKKGLFYYSHSKCVNDSPAVQLFADLISHEDNFDNGGLGWLKMTASSLLLHLIAFAKKGTLVKSKKNFAKYQNNELTDRTAGEEM